MIFFEIKLTFFVLVKKPTKEKKPLTFRAKKNLG